jgi:hypothetical protein
MGSACSFASASSLPPLVTPPHNAAPSHACDRWSCSHLEEGNGHISCQQDRSRTL